MGHLKLALLVPVLRRPQNVQPLLDSIRETTPQPYRVLFICDPADRYEMDAIGQAGGEFIVCGGRYSTKINRAVRLTTEPLLFLGADDITPMAGWLEGAKAKLAQGAELVGVNDLIPRPHRGVHATHFLVTRSYALRPTIDGVAGPLSTAYAHNFCDDELIATATKRGVYTYAADSHVRHNHPMVGVPEDSTYRRGKASFRRDRRTFHRRAALWA